MCPRRAMYTYGGLSTGHSGHAIIDIARVFRLYRRVVLGETIGEMLIVCRLVVIKKEGNDIVSV
jgi:hypothetical protein